MLRIHRLHASLVCAAVLGASTVALAQAVDRTPAALKGVIAVEPADSTFGAYRIVFTTAKPLPPASDASPGQGFMLDDQAVSLPPSAPAGTTHFGYFKKLPAGQTATLRTGLSTDLAQGTPSSTLPVEVRKLLAAGRRKDGEYEAPHIRRSDQKVDLVPALADAQLVIVARYVRQCSDPDDKSLWQMHFEPQDEPLKGAAATTDKTIVFRSTTVPAWYEMGARYVIFARLLPGTQRIDPREHVGVRIWWAEGDPVLEFVKQADRLWPPSKPRQNPKSRDELTAGLRSPAPEVRLASALALVRLGKPPAGDQTTSQKAQLDSLYPKEPVEAVRTVLRILQQMITGPVPNRAPPK